MHVRCGPCTRRQAGVDVQGSHGAEGDAPLPARHRSGAIGIEFASFYRTLGADVTVVEIMDRVLPVEDEEISTFARKSFEKQGMKIRTGTSVERLEVGQSNVKAQLKAKEGALSDVTVDRVILAIGNTGNVENLGLEALGVKVDRGHIVH